MSKEVKKRKRILKKSGIQTCKCTKNECNNKYCSCRRSNKKCSSECGCSGCMNNTFIKKISCKIEDFSFFSFDFNSKPTFHINNLWIKYIRFNDLFFIYGNNYLKYKLQHHSLGDNHSGNIPETNLSA